METKRVIISLMVLCCAMAVKAQNDVAIATLQHGDNVSVFKGSSALASALAAASDQGGDVITLSEGTFTAATITKPVSIYGAGFETDNAKGTQLTTISGNLTVGKGDNTTLSNVHLEGFALFAKYELHQVPELYPDLFQTLQCDVFPEHLRQHHVDGLHLGVNLGNHGFLGQGLGNGDDVLDTARP